MLCRLTISKYPKGLALFGMLSMVLFRIVLAFNKKITFYKLLGCGKNGTFDIHPDWRQWALLTVYEEEVINEDDEKEVQQKATLPQFISAYFQLFKCRNVDYFLLPIEGHGTWDHKFCFGNIPLKTDYDGMIAVLTRATIRVKKLKRFWSHVDAVTNEMKSADGFITSIGIGEIPFIKNGTFSLWKNKESIKNFAYKMQSHNTVIAKTRKEKWYSEELFVRFKPLLINGLSQDNNL